MLRGRKADGTDRRSGGGGGPGQCAGRAGHGPLCPRLDGQVCGRAGCRGAARRDRRGGGLPAGGGGPRCRCGPDQRQHGAGRRDDDQRRPDDQPREDEPHPRRQARRASCGGRGGGDPVAPARRGRGGRVVFPPVVRRARVGHAGGRAVHQCGRVERPALWVHPRLVSWA